MDWRERVLYHQIHPFKLLADWSTAFIAAWLLWRHELGWALVVGFVPSVVVSAWMIGACDLRAYKDSRFGRYIAQSMTRAVEAVRFLGLAFFWLGAWRHNAWLMAAGVAVIIAAWLRGVLLPVKER
jgi:hypothetical protein